MSSTAICFHEISTTIVSASLGVGMVIIPCGLLTFILIRYFNNSKHPGFQATTFSLFITTGLVLIWPISMELFKIIDRVVSNKGLFLCEPLWAGVNCCQLFLDTYLFEMCYLASSVMSILYTWVLAFCFGRIKLNKIDSAPEN